MTGRVRAPFIPIMPNLEADRVSRSLCAAPLFRKMIKDLLIGRTDEPAFLASMGAMIELFIEEPEEG